MHRDHDDIPMLPSRPLPKRHRRSNRPFFVAVVAVAVLAVVVTGWAVQRRFAAMADEVLARADELFDSGAFAKAQREYELFRNEYPSDPRSANTQTAADLAAAAQSLNDELADPARVIGSLGKFAADVADDPVVRDRWPLFLTLAHRRARTAIERSLRTLDAADLAAGETWLRWLHDQQTARVNGSDAVELADLDAAVRETRVAIAASSERRRVLDVAEESMREPTPERLAAAFQAVRKANADPAKPDPQFVELLNRLRQTLRDQVRVVAAEPASQSAPGVPRLPIEAYTRLTAHTETPPTPAPTRDPALIRTKDLCFALEPATGAVRWVLRVGYDAPTPELVALPSGRAVLVTWAPSRAPAQVAESIQLASMLSLCDAATGEAIWSWQSPAPLVGPPAVARDAVFAATGDAQVFQLDLQHGTPRGRIQLPEPIDGPPTLREDRGGLCIVGARNAVYLFDVSGESTRCGDVALLERRRDSAGCHALWVLSYVVVFDNSLMDRCFVRVLHNGPSGYGLVRELEIAGRVWDPPVVDGAQLFVITDRWQQHCFGLDPDDAAINLFTAATVPQHGGPAQPVRPRFARSNEAPFLSLTNALRAYRVDPVRAVFTELWRRPAPHSAAAGNGPIQSRGNLAIVTWPEAAGDGSHIEAVAAASGELVWSTHLSLIGRDVAPVGATVLIRNERGALFAIARDSGMWQSRPLNVPAPTSSARVTADGQRIVYVSDSGTRLQSIATADWQGREPLPLAAAAATDLSLLEGTVAVAGPGSPTERTGRWVLFVSTDRKLEMRPIDGPDEIHAARLPAVRSGNELWTWPPRVIADRHIIVAHSSGTICRAELRQAEGIVHLFVSDVRDDLPPLAAPPVAIGERLLCAGSGGRCLLLDPMTLKTIAEWDAKSPIHALAAGDYALAAIQANDKLQTLRIDTMGLAVHWETPLEGSGWTLSAEPGRLFAVHETGLVRSIDPMSGKTTAELQALAPLALPPRTVDGELVLCTMDGGVHFLAIPDRR
jgi:outer membrane protein assembly factor BamB